MSIPEIDVDELADLLEGAEGAVGAIRLIDVREPDEYATAHVPGAVLVPLATVPEQLDAFRGDGSTYVICQAGGRSRRAAEYAAAEGIEVVNVAGGTGAWIASGRHVVSGSS